MQPKLDDVNNWLLMSSPVTPVVILASYLIFVLKIGPNYMKDRKPFQIQKIITFYNAVQVALSVYLVYTCAKMIGLHGLIPKTCFLDTEDGKIGIDATMHLYLLAKVSELLDTIFFVLRKKNRQLSFLHVYHHSIVFFSTWLALKYEPCVHLLVTGLLNSFVHVVMYGYYGLSVFSSLTKYLWWKKYITRLQLAQFVVILCHFNVATYYSNCTPSYILLFTIYSNGALFLYLFGKFYLNNYSIKVSKMASDPAINKTSAYTASDEKSLEKNIKNYEIMNGKNSNRGN